MFEIDIFMPVAPKDAFKAQHSLRGILDNCLNPIRNIYIATPERFELKELEAEEGVNLHWILDAEFPFSVQDLRDVFLERHSTWENASWYYQQLLKFYVFEAIEGLLDHVLILDSDFMIARPTQFVNDHGKAMLAYGYPFKWLQGTTDYPQEVEHIHATFAAELIPGWSPRHCYSGMQHHMLLERRIVKDLFEVVEQRWRRPFWEAFIHLVDVEKWNAAAEYVIYHHFALWRHQEKVVLRHLNACDLIFDSEEPCPSWEVIDGLAEVDAHGAVGFHGFLKLRERLATMDYIPDNLKQELLQAQQLVFKLTLFEGTLQIAEMQQPAAYEMSY